MSAAHQFALLLHQCLFRRHRLRLFPSPPLFKGESPVHRGADRGPLRRSQPRRHRRVLPRGRHRRPLPGPDSYPDRPGGHRGQPLGTGFGGSFWPFLAVFWAFGLSLQLFRLSLDTLLFKEDHGDTPRRLGQYNAMRMGGMMVGTLLAGAGCYWLDFPATLKLFSAGTLLLIAPTVKLPLTRGVPTTLFEYGRDFLAPRCCFSSPGSFCHPALGRRGHQPGPVPGAQPGFFAPGGGRVYGRRVRGGGAHRLSLRPLLGPAPEAPHLSGPGPDFFRRRAHLDDLPGPALVLCLAAVHGFGDGLILMETYTTITRLFHVDRIGGSASLISLTTTLGIFAGSLIFGPLGAAYGCQVPLIVSGAISLALLPLAYAGLRD